MSEQFSNPEQALIERLRRAPQPELRAEARQAIHMRLMDAIDHPGPAPRPALPRPMMVAIVVVIAAALIAGGILLVLSRQTQPNNPPTIPATLTQATPTATPTASPTATLTATITLTVTVQPTYTLMPTSLPTATTSTIMVIEGPVENITGNIIVIYGIPIQLDPNDPILTTIKIGEVLSIKGDTRGTSKVVIVGSTATETVNSGSNVNPPSGEVWQDDGNCSHPPPDWAPANGWRRRCQGQEKEKDKGDKPNKK